MTVSLALVVCGGVVFAAGTALLLARSLSRIVIGMVTLGNGVNILLLATTGRAGDPPLLAPGTRVGRITDPLPQAMALTAIVITLALTAFLLSMAYRTWQLSGDDEVQDDLEDRRVALRGEYHALRRERYTAAARHRTGRGGGRDPLDRLRAEHQQSRERQRRLRRVERARRARAADLGGDLWDNVLGEDR
ncbi:hypothetical protein GCM10010129_42910 [Streptomyces fumigatiscleroticus]|nr:hypothetical protein GCM10010129_42910 [Streptomyces fumigatiscleroticus]